MKSTFYQNYILVLLVLLVPFSRLYCTSDDNESFTIVNSKQKISFYLVKNELKAKLETEELIRCNIISGGKFRKFLFFDNTSEISTIVKNGRLTKPIITDDFPKNGIFHSDSKLAYVDHDFTMQNKDLVLKTEKLFEDFKFIDLLKFQLYAYAVTNSEILIEVPNWLKCDIQKFNFEGFNIKETFNENRKSTTYSFTVMELKAVKTFKAEPDIRRFQPHIMLLPKELTLDKEVKTLFPDIKSLYGWYNSLANEVENDNSVLVTLVDEITSGMTNQLDKIKAIFYYVQNNIKYVAFEHGIMGFKPESCQNVLKNKYGDCKGMANLTKEMLQLIGIDARLTWLGTDGTPYNYTFPSVYVDNHMICTVLLDGQFIFLDPTEKHNDLLVYANRIQGREVLIQDGDKYIRMKVPNQDGEEHLTQHELEMNIEGTRLNGRGSIEMRGNSKANFVSFLQSVGDKNKEKAIQYFIAKNDNNIIAKTNHTDITPIRDEDYILNYELVAENQILTSGKEKYINLEFERPLGNLLIEEDRNRGFFHGFKHFEKSKIYLQIPPNHTVTYLPEAISERNELGSFHLSYEVKNNKVFYNRNITLNATEIPVGNFMEWKKLIKQLNTFYDDRIILEVVK